MNALRTILYSFLLGMMASIPAYPGSSSANMGNGNAALMESDIGYLETELYYESNIAGNSIYINSTLKNYGAQDVDDLYLKYYLSTDSIYDAADVFLNYISIYRIYANQSTDIIRSLQIPYETPEGDYFIICRIVDSEDEYDSNPGNNIAHYPLKIRAAEMDLEISFLDLYSNNLRSGIANGLNLRVKNTGNVTAITCMVGFYLSEDMHLDSLDTEISRNTIYSISPGYERSVNHTINIPDQFEAKGIYYLIIKADVENVVKETNENNNEILTQVLISRQVLDGGNLSINRMWSQSETLTNTEPLKTFFSLDLMTGSRVKMETWLSSDSILEFEKDILLKDNYYTGNYERDFITSGYIQLDSTMISNIDFGNNYLISMIDPDSLVNEDDETDNIAFTELYIDSIAYPDVSITGLTTSRDSIITGRYADIECFISNSGSIRVSTEVSWYLSEDDLFDSGDLKIGEYYISGIYPGDERNIKNRVSLDDVNPGFYKLLCVADPENKIEEMDEDNNMQTISLLIVHDSIQGRNDIELTGVICEDTLYTGAGISLEFEMISYYTEYKEIYYGCFLSADSIFDAGDFSNQLFSFFYYTPAYYGSNFRNEFILSKNLPAGKYYLICKADYKNQFIEENELNNVVIKPVLVLPQPETLDLTVSEVEISNVVHYPSSKVKGSFSCFNKGSVTADTAVYNIYFARDAGSGEKNLIYSDSIFYLGENEIVVPFEFILPDTLENMLYRILIELTSSGGQPDIHPADNRTFFTIGIQDPEVDFVLENLRINGQIYETFNLDLYFEVTNAGSTLCENTGVSFYLSSDNLFSPDDILLNHYDLEVTGIGNKQSFEKVITFQPITSGHYFLIVVIDPDNEVPESDEMNNMITTEIEVLPSGSNLIIEEVILSSTEIAINQTVTVDLKVRNSGNLSTPSTYIGYFISADSVFDAGDFLVYSSYLGPLSEGSTADRPSSFQLTNTFPTGDYYLITKVDHENQIPETNEEDNFYRIPIQIIPTDIDLVLSAEGIPVPFNIPNKNTDIDFQAKNNGKHSFEGKSTLKFYISTDSIFNPVEDYHLKEWQLYFNLYAGHKTDLSSQLNIKDLALGKYFLIMQIDAYNLIEETNEENNILIIPIEIMEPHIDLVVSQLELSEDSLVENALVSCDVQIMNKGQTLTDNGFYTRIYLSADTIPDNNDFLLMSFFTSSLSAAETYEYSSNFRIPYGYTGSYYFVCYTDASNGVNETREDNNISFAPIHIEAPDIDITVGNGTVTPGEASTGETVNILCEVRNIGNVSTGRYFYLGYYFSEDSFLDETDALIGTRYIPGLGANTSYLESINYKLPAVDSGIYYLIFVADYNNSISEVNEDNNTGFVPVTVHKTDEKPDYLIKDLQVSISGKTVNAWFDVSNKSLGPAANASECYVYFSNDERLDEGDSIINVYEVPPLNTEDSVSLNFTARFEFLEYRYIVIAADIHNEVDEKNEENNNWIINLPLMEFDVEITTEFRIESASPGDTVMVGFNLSSVGLNPLDSISLHYLLSDDEIPDDKDRNLFSHNINALGNGQEISVEQQVIIPPDIPAGSYMLMIQANRDTFWIEKNHHNNIASVYYYISEKLVSTSLEEQNVVLVYPNPASEVLNIRADLKLEEYKIVDSRGREVRNGLINKVNASIYLNSLPDGVYFLLLKTENSQKILRFEKIH